MLLLEIQNPFSNSKVQEVVYHGDSQQHLTKFIRHPQGVWFARSRKYSETHYTKQGQGQVYECYIDVRNPYFPTEEEDDKWYGDYNISTFFTQLKEQGYDSYEQRGESGSIAVFETVQIYNINTGQLM